MFSSYRSTLLLAASFLCSLSFASAEYNSMCGKVGGPPIADGSTMTNAEVLQVRQEVCGNVASSNTCNWCTSDDFMYTGECTGGCCQNDYQTCAILE